MPQNYSSCFPANTPPTSYPSPGATQTNFPIGFPYLKESDVVVFKEVSSNWTIVALADYSITGTNVVFGTAPNVPVLIMRKTDMCDLVRTYQAGQSIRAQDLNNSFKQSLYQYQEIYEYISYMIGGGELLPEGDTLEERFWNQTTDTIDSSEAWASDNNHVATTAAITAQINTSAGGQNLQAVCTRGNETNTGITFSEPSDAQVCYETKSSQSGTPTLTSRMWSEGAMVLGGTVGNTFVASTPEIALNGVDGSASFATNEFQIASTGKLTLSDSAANLGIQLGTGADFTFRRGQNGGDAAQIGANGDMTRLVFNVGGTDISSINATTFGVGGATPGTAPIQLWSSGWARFSNTASDPDSFTWINSTGGPSGVGLHISNTDAVGTARISLGSNGQLKAASTSVVTEFTRQTAAVIGSTHSILKSGPIGTIITIGQIQCDGTYHIGGSDSNSNIELRAAGQVLLRGRQNVSTTHHITIQAPQTDASFTGDWTLTLPEDAGTSGQVLRTDGSGTTTWVDPDSSDVWTRDGTNIHPTNIGDSVGIGTTTPQAKLEVSGNEIESWVSDTSPGGDAGNTGAAFVMSRDNGTANDLETGDFIGRLKYRGVATDASYIGAEILAKVTTGGVNRNNSQCQLEFGTMGGSQNGSVTKATLTGLGQWLVGNNSSISSKYLTAAGWQGFLQVSTSAQQALSSLSIWDDTAATYASWGGVQSHFLACKSGTIGSHAGGALGNNDAIGTIVFSGSDGSEFGNSAFIQGSKDGAGGTGKTPGRLTFWTTDSTNSTPKERVRISSDGEYWFTPFGSTSNLWLKMSQSGTEDFIISSQRDGAHDTNLILQAQNGTDGVLKQMEFTHDGTLNLGRKGAGITDSGNNIILYVGATNEGYSTVGGQYNSTNTANKSEIRFGVQNNATGSSFMAFATRSSGSPTEKMRISGNGEVRIRNQAGGTNSAGLLNVNLGDSSTYSTGIVTIKNAGDRGSKGNASGSPLLGCYYNNATALLVDKDGGVGVGTSTPPTPDGTNSDNPVNGFTGVSVYGQDPYINLVSDRANAGYSTLNFGRLGGSSNQYRFGISYEQSSDTGILFGNNDIVWRDSANSATNKMMLLNTGAVQMGNGAGGGYGLHHGLKAVVANGNSTSVTLPCTSFVGTLYVISAVTGSAGNRKSSTYFVTGRLTGGVEITELNSKDDGSGAAFNVTDSSTGSNNILTVTNSSGNQCDVSMYFVGAMNS